MQIDYKISIKDPTGLAAPVTPMNEILAYKQVNRQIYACGYRYDLPNDFGTALKDTSTASIF